ncbi:MAG: glycosyltransferase [Xylophilus ampelinus]
MSPTPRHAAAAVVPDTPAELDLSVVCPVFNTRPALLEQAVGSVLAQDFGARAMEIVLVDDASTATDTRGSLADLEARHPGAVRVVRMARNGGPARARNAGLAAAAHPWIGFIDADDLWPAGKMEDARRILAAHPDAGWIAGNFAVLERTGEPAPSVPLTDKCASEKTSAWSRRIASAALSRTLANDWMHLGTSLVRKQLLQAAGGFDERLTYGEDWLLFLKLATLTPLDYSHAVGYILRRQEASMMRSAPRMTSRFSRSSEIAARDPALRSLRREIRWFRYKVYKDLAMNNLINGHGARALYFATRAFAVSPDEYREYAFFLSLFGKRRHSDIDSMLFKYSKTEQVRLENVPS